MREVVVVTGVGSRLGAAVAAELARRRPDATVVGLDGGAPTEPVPGVDCRRVDLRSRALGDLLGALDVTIVVHVALLEPSWRMGRAGQKDLNVLGTMRLLAAAERRPTLRHVVLASTTAVHGAAPRGPAVHTPLTRTAGPLSDGLGRDCVEAESQVRALARHRPEVSTVTVRLADIIGPGTRTPLSDYLRLPILPVPLGRDPRLQVLHIDDAVSALVNAALLPDAGSQVVDVAGEGVVTLTQAAAIVGRPWVPVPPGLGRWLRGRLARRGQAALTQEHEALLTWGRVVDTSAMRAGILPDPRHTTRSALATMAVPRAVAPGAHP